MTTFLELPLPDGCSAAYVGSLLPVRRHPLPTSDYDGESLRVEWTGEPQDREVARTEIRAALAEAGIAAAAVRFFDDR